MTIFNLTRGGYYADFALAPLFMLALVAGLAGVDAMGVMLAGLLAWTLAEYLLHRYVFHRAPVLRLEHDRHHEDPGAYIGVSVFATAPIFLVLWLLARVALGHRFGDAFTVGLVAGYFAYIVVHDQFHHGKLRPGDLLYSGFHRHALHHRGLQANFGVTTPLWDFVFRTLHNKPAR